MNQYLVDIIIDHNNWIHHVNPRKICYSDNISEKYNLDDIIVYQSENYYKYSAELYLDYYIYLIVAE